MTGIEGKGEVGGEEDTEAGRETHGEMLLSWQQKNVQDRQGAYFAVLKGIDTEQHDYRKYIQFFI